MVEVTGFEPATFWSRNPNMCSRMSFHVALLLRRKPCKMTWADIEKHILLPIRCNKTQIRTKDSARLGISLAWETTIKNHSNYA